MRFIMSKCIRKRLCFWLTLGLLLACCLCLPQRTDAESGGIRALTQTGQAIKLYKDYQALVIGVGGYKHWPQLPGYLSDAQKVAAALESQGFLVRLVIDPDSAQLKRIIQEIPFEYGLEPQRGLLVYYAGHGGTEVLANQKNLGYIVPTDSPLMSRDQPGFVRSAVSMNDIEAMALRIKSRHVLMVFDSCLSDAVFDLVRASPQPIGLAISRPVRQFIFSCPKNQQRPNSGFSNAFIDGIKGQADLDSDGYVTGSELGGYLQGRMSKQADGGHVVKFGLIRDADLRRGEMIFVDPAGSGLDPAKARIARLLKEAQALWEDGKLTTPSENNARQKYIQVLLLDPLNNRALSGLDRIVQRYAKWARSQMKEGNLAKAESLIERAAGVREGDELVMALRQELKQARLKEAGVIDLNPDAQAQKPLAAMSPKPQPGPDSGIKGSLTVSACLDDGSLVPVNQPIWVFVEVFDRQAKRIAVLRQKADSEGKAVFDYSLFGRGAHEARLLAFWPRYLEEIPDENQAEAKKVYFCPALKTIRALDRKGTVPRSLELRLRKMPERPAADPKVKAEYEQVVLELNGKKAAVGSGHGVLQGNYKIWIPLSDVNGVPLENMRAMLLLYGQDAEMTQGRVTATRMHDKGWSFAGFPAEAFNRRVRAARLFLYSAAQPGRYIPKLIELDPRDAKLFESSSSSPGQNGALFKDVKIEIMPAGKKQARL